MRRTSGAPLAAFKKASGTAPAAITGETLTGSAVVSTMSASRVAPRTDGDYDGDGKADVAVFTPSTDYASTGSWSILQSSTNTLRTITWGGSSDVPMPGDYDGDGATDLAVFRPSTGLWQILRSSTNTTRPSRGG